jgi:hypothetical protein
VLDWTGRGFDDVTVRRSPIDGWNLTAHTRIWQPTSMETAVL